MATHRYTMATGMDEGVAEWTRFASHRPTEHGSPPPTQHRPLPSLPLHMRNLLGQYMLPCTLKRVPRLPNTAMPTKSCTHLHLGSIITITLTLPSAYSPELLHNSRGMNYAHVWFITLIKLSCYFPNCPSCSTCYSTTHYLTMYMCFCLWMWALKQRWHRTTRRWRKTNWPDDDSDFERPSQSSTPILPTHTKNPCIVGSMCLFRPWEW